MQSNVVHLVTSADNNYVQPLAVMLKSAESNLQSGWSLQVYVLDGGVARRNRRKIEKDLNSPKVKVCWVFTKGQAALKGVPVFGHVTVATYYRVLLADLLPEVDRAIYLDADTVVVGDLADLWQMDMGDKMILAVQECQLTIGSSPESLPEFEVLGIPPETPLFNGGVFMADLRKWRLARVSGRVLEYINRNRDHILYWDQDGLNAILWKDVGLLPKRWNYRIDCGVNAETGGSGEGHISNVQQFASIVHYASALKPWHYYACHPAKALYFQYLDRTAWAGWRPKMPWKGIRNPHLWGQAIRGLPVIGAMWKWWRDELKH